MLTGPIPEENGESNAGALKASETRFRRLFETASDGILILNANSGLVIDANPCLRELLGFRHDYMLGKPLWKIGIFADKEMNEAIIRRILESASFRLGSLSVETRTGEHRLVEFVANVYDEDGQSVIQCNIRDITERKGYENELAAANAQSSIILESMTDGYFILARDWQFTYFNEQAEQLLLRTADEVIGNSIWDMFPEAVGTPFEVNYRRAMGEQVVVEFEEWFAPLALWVDVRAFPSAAGLSVYFTDITVRKKAEKALKDSEAHLRLSADGVGLGLWQYLTSTREIKLTPLGYKLFGLPEDGSVPVTQEIIGAAIHPDDVRPTFAALSEALRAVTDFDVVFRIVREGQTRWIRSHGKPHLNESGSVEWLQGVLSDITPQKIAEAERDASDLTNELIVETLQRSLIQILPPGKFPGLDVEHLFVPGDNEAAIGGDFFDTFALTETKIAFVVGDVLGKGLDAVGRTTEVKFALRALMHEYPAPDLALARLNDYLYSAYHLDTGNPGTFVIIAVVVVDSTDGTATFSAAGAEPALILRGNGSLEAVETSAVPLGIQRESQYISAERQLASGETVVMLSDGITGSRRGPAVFGLDGATAIVESLGPVASLEQLAQGIYEGAVDFAGDVLRDDVCLLLARRSG